MNWVVDWTSVVEVNIHDVGRERSERVLRALWRLAAREDLDVAGEAEVDGGDVVAAVLFDPRERIIWIQRISLRQR